MKPNHETIYLVPTDYDGGQLTYSWCDCPAPGQGMDPADAIKYVRADLVPASNELLARRIVELTNERDAVLAQVEQLLKPAKEAAEALGFSSHHLRGRASEKMLMDMAKKADALISAIGLTPAQCFAEIKAQAVEDAANELASMISAPPGIYSGAVIKLNLIANQLRQQAKAGE